MIMLQGKGVSKGVANGPLYFFQRPDTTISDTPAADIEAEKARIAAAQKKAIDQLNALADKAREDTGDETAILFETHAMFVEDEDYVDCMMNTLTERGCLAEKAVELAGEEFAAMLAAMDDPYMQGRAADIKDVTRRILNNLMGIAEGGIDSEVPVILAADDLAPLKPSSWTNPRFWALSPRAVPATATPPFLPGRWAFPPSAAWARPSKRTSPDGRSTLTVKPARWLLTPIKSPCPPSRPRWKSSGK